MAIKKKVEIKQEKPSKATYVNSTKRNVFTTVGRVMAGETVALLLSEGDSTEGLTLAED